MTISIKSNPDGVSGAIQVNGVDKVTIGASGITAGSFAPNSIDAAAVALAFSGANQSLAASGYQKLPSGLIIQWGVTGGITSGSSVNVTFPIAFSTGPLVGVASVYVAGNVTMSGLFGTNVGSGSTATAMKIFAFTGNGTAQPAHWIAIGY